jgi:hypothetical protein
MASVGSPARDLRLSRRPRDEHALCRARPLPRATATNGLQAAAGRGAPPPIRHQRLQQW